MYVKDLTPNKKVDEIVLIIDELEEERTFLTRWGAEGRVRNGVAHDENGDKVKVAFWNDEIDRVDVGSRIRITNGYAKMWNGEMQISAGRYGHLSVEE